MAGPPLWRAGATGVVEGSACDRRSLLAFDRPV